MSRTVSTPAGAIVLAYAHYEDNGDADAQEQWDDIVSGIKCVLRYRYRSLNEIDRWVGREDHAVLENDLVVIGISEYVGTISIWALPKSGIGETWARNIVVGAQHMLAPLFGGELMRRIATFDNGEAVFQIFKP